MRHKMQHIAAFELCFSEFQRGCRDIGSYLSSRLKAGMTSLGLFCLGAVMATHAQSDLDLQSDLAECKSLVVIGGLPIDCDKAFSDANLHPLQPHPADVAWPTKAWDIGDMPTDTALISSVKSPKQLSSSRLATNRQEQTCLAP